MSKIQIVYNVNSTQYSDEQLKCLVDALKNEILASARTLWRNSSVMVRIVASRTNNLKVIGQDNEDKLAKLQEDIDACIEDAAGV